MKRLTDNYEKYISRFSEEYLGKRKLYSINSGVIYEKLGAYEDLEDRLRTIYGECDGLLGKLVENLEKHDGIDIQDPAFKVILLTDSEVDRWEEYKNLEEHGKLLKLPCAVGDMVYAYCSQFGVLEYTVDCIIVDGNITFQCSSYSEIECFDEIEPSILEFGKTVFFTREEAEAALKKIRERKG